VPVNRAALVPILRAISVPATTLDFENGTVANTIKTMQDILNGIKAISDENGNAISAPQVGVSIRLIVLRIAGKFVNIINPILSEQSANTFMFEEECFSFYSVRASVKRHQCVTLNYKDETQRLQSRIMQGEFSGLIQHEVDHLNGIFFLDKVEDKASVESIDYVFKDEPRRLDVVKKMCGYMSSPSGTVS
jgi:peptide deformylase